MNADPDPVGKMKADPDPQPWGNVYIFITKAYVSCLFPWPRMREHGWNQPNCDHAEHLLHTKECPVGFISSCFFINIFIPSRKKKFQKFFVDFL